MQLKTLRFSRSYFVDRCIYISDRCKRDKKICGLYSCTCGLEHSLNRLSCQVLTWCQTTPSQSQPNVWKCARAALKNWIFKSEAMRTCFSFSLLLKIKVKDCNTHTSVENHTTIITAVVMAVLVAAVLATYGTQRKSTCHGWLTAKFSAKTQWK